MKTFVLALFLALPWGCSHPSQNQPAWRETPKTTEEPAWRETPKTTEEPVESEPASVVSPQDWSAFLGQQVTVEGIAMDAKVGAFLRTADSKIWIDGRDSWPTGYYQGGDQGKRLRVTGTVIERADLPVFVAEDGEPKLAGMPVPPGTDLEKARRRFLLENATWTVLE